MKARDSLNPAAVSHKTLILIALPAFCLLSLVVKENYPFSNFPMYGNPSPTSEYFYLTDGDNHELALGKLTGKRARDGGSLGKLIRKYRDERLAELKIKGTKLPDADRDLAAKKVLDYLRQEAAFNHHPMPAKLKVMLTEIAYIDGKVVETPQLYYAEP